MMNEDVKKTSAGDAPLRFMTGDNLLESVAQTIEFVTIPAGALGSQKLAMQQLVKQEDKGDKDSCAATNSLSVAISSPASQMPATPASDVLSEDGYPLSPASALSPSANGGGKMRSRLKASLSGTKEDRICGVCGDKALGCNFDAVSCESCKAFFRRNALKDKKTKCLFDGSCKIDINTRRFCPHCRLKKCFIVGMKKELILGDADKKKRAEKVRQNREKRVTGGKGSSSNQDDDSMEMDGSMVSVDTPLSPAAVVEPQVAAQIVVASSSVVEVGKAASPSVTQVTLPPPQIIPVSSPMPPITTTTPTVASTIVLPPGLSATTSYTASTSSPSTSSSSNNKAQSLVESSNLLSLSKLVAPAQESTEATHSTLAQMSPCLTQMDSFLLRKLSDDESRMLTDLMQVYDLSFTVDLEPLIHIKQLDPSLNQLVNQSSVTVLRLIKFAKRLEDFVSLPQEVQIGILKGCWIHILLLRSVSLYDCNRDVWVTPRGDIPTEILKNATGYIRLHDTHVNYCNSLKSIIGDDLMIVVLLLVIVIFAPDGPHVVARQLVSNIQDKYLVLLKHYLESKYTYTRASEMYPKLMAKMMELKELAEDHGKYLLDVNPREIEPIMLEILDLK